MKLGLTLAPAQELSLVQQVALRQSHELGLRLALIQALRDEEYKPKGDCPRCGRVLTLREILHGFREDPQDFTTLCTGCQHRFEPKLICRTASGYIEMPFFCSAQVLEKLHGLEYVSVDDFNLNYGPVYRSVIFHHGTLTRAFRKLGLTYAHDEQLAWQEKIKPFLGRLPDAVIAEYTPVSAKLIGNYRKSLRIAAYNAKKSLEDAERESAQQ